jgi:hypothetical protein
MKTNGQRRYKCLVLGKDGSYFFFKGTKNKTHYDSTKKLSENYIINMLVFMIDSIHVMFGGLVLQQTVGIPMGSNCAPLLADLLFYSYEADFIQELVKKKTKTKLARSFNFTFLYIDDVFH